MNPARIAELLQPFLEEERLSSAQLSSISTYIDILLRWNARINLTAIRDPEEIITRHFGESLFAARHLFPVSSLTVQEIPLCTPVPSVVRLADLGSGAGFPGLPIKLWAPHVALTLIESNHKKATFLREVVRALTLTDVDVQNARAQSLPPRTYDVVTLRAVERFDAIVPVAASLVADDGCLALLISSAQVPQLRTALAPHNISSLLPIPSSNSKILAVAQKPKTLM
jgi:16S rRNA (guanine527-N7)-methyltransferase